MLLVAIVTGAKADTELLSYTTTSTAPAAKTDIQAGSGTIQAGSAFAPDAASVSGSYGWKLDGDPTAEKATSKYVQATLASGQTFQVGDVISISGYSASNATADNPQGFSLYNGAGGSTDLAQYGHTIDKTTKKKTLFTLNFTVGLGSNLIGKNTVYIGRYYPSGEKGVTSYFTGVTIVRPASTTSPDITTQPKDVWYIKGKTTCDNMSVVAAPLTPGDELKYQWQYSLNGETFFDIPAPAVPSAKESILNGTQAIAILNNLDPIPDKAYIRCVVSETGAEDAISDVATVYIVDGVAPTISVAANKTVALKGDEKIKLTATVTGTPDPTIQWYSKNGGITTVIEGATGAEYTPATTTYGTFEYVAKATNGAGVADSDPIAITVKPALQSVNTNIGVYGAITEPADAEQKGKIEFPYINAGETGEVDETTWKAWNDNDATISTEENIITVTSGNFKAEYEYQFIPVEPIEVTTDIAASFTEVPYWVVNNYGYDATKGLKFAKAVDDADNMRIAKGNTRQYYFVGPAKSMTLTAIGDARQVNVYVNGTKVKTADNNNIGTITLSETKNNLVIIEAAAGTKGDGGFSAYSIAATTTAINGVAEDAAVAEDAKVKVINNNKLYIGNYNIAGQLVK